MYELLPLPDFELELLELDKSVMTKVSETTIVDSASTITMTKLSSAVIEVSGVHE